MLHKKSKKPILGCVRQLKLVEKKRRKSLFSRSADAQVKRMRKWFRSRWPFHTLAPELIRLSRYFKTVIYPAKP
jgi:hypothetical protein